MTNLAQRKVLSLCDDIFELKEYQSPRTFKTFSTGNYQFRKNLITGLRAELLNLEMKNKMIVDGHLSSFVNGKGEPLSTDTPFGYEERLQLIKKYEEEIIPRYQSLMDKVA